MKELEPMRSRSRVCWERACSNKAIARTEHEAEIADETHGLICKVCALTGLSEEEIVDKSAMQLQSLFRGNLARKTLAKNRKA